MGGKWGKLELEIGCGSLNIPYSVPAVPENGYRLRGMGSRNTFKSETDLK